MSFSLSQFPLRARGSQTLGIMWQGVISYNCASPLYFSLQSLHGGQWLSEEVSLAQHKSVSVWCSEVICGLLILPVCTNINISEDQTMTSLMTSSGVMTEGRGRPKNNATLAYLRCLIKDIWSLVMGKSWISVVWGVFFLYLPPPSLHPSFNCRL